MTETNEELRQKLETLQPLLQRRDLIGYVCARNYRVIADALAEYVAVKNALLAECGGVRDDGVPYIEPSMPRYEEFIERYEPIASVAQDVAIMPLKYTDVVGQLTGEEMLEIDWMLED